MDEDILKALRNTVNPEWMNEIRQNLSSIDSSVSQVAKLDDFAKAVEQINRQNDSFQSLRFQAAQNNINIPTVGSLAILWKSFTYNEMLSATSTLETIGKVDKPAFKLLDINTTTSAIEVFSQLGANTTLLSKLDLVHAQSIFRNDTILSDFMKSLSIINLDNPILKDIIENSVGQLSKEFIDTISISKQYEKISALASFKTISKFKDFPFDEVLIVDYEYGLDIENASNKTIVEIDDEISDELFSVDNYGELSDDARNKLSYIYHTYILPIIFLLLSVPINILANHHALLLLQEINLVKTKQEVKSTVRRSSLIFDREALKGYRVTIVDNLNLCSDNRMDSNVIEVLPIGTIVKIIDKSNRSWLRVKVDINGELEQGWVLRRYTTYFK